MRAFIRKRANTKDNFLYQKVLYTWHRKQWFTKHLAFLRVLCLAFETLGPCPLLLSPGWCTSLSHLTSRRSTCLCAASVHSRLNWSELQDQPKSPEGQKKKVFQSPEGQKEKVFLSKIHYSERHVECFWSTHANKVSILPPTEAQQDKVPISCRL